MPITNGSLAQKIDDLVTFYDTREKEFRDWLSGVVGGGPGADGKFPLTDFLGVLRLTKSPAQLEDDVNGTVNSAVTHKDDAATSAAAALVSETNAGNDETAADGHRINALNSQSAAASSASAAANDAVTATASKDAAKVSEDNAAASADAAASGDLSAATSVKFRSYTVATLPSASTEGAGAQIFVSDEVGGAVMAQSNGTLWQRLTDLATVA